MSDSKTAGVWDDAAKARARNALLAALVSDCAAMSLHWIYDQGKVAGLVAAHGATFVDPPHTPYYKHPAGSVSPYGAELHALCKSMTKRGGIDANAFAEDCVEYMTAYGGYKNGTTRALIARFAEGKRYPDCGSDDSEANSMVKVPAVVAQYAGTAELRTKVEEAVRVQQNNDQAVHNALAAAAVLEKVIFGATPQDAVKAVAADESIDAGSRARLQTVIEGAETAHSAFVSKHGLSCGDPGAFMGGFHTAFTSSDLKTAVTNEILAAGDTCGRLAFGAAVVAAHQGKDAIPEEWTTKATSYAEYVSIADTIVGQHA